MLIFDLFVFNGFVEDLLLIMFMLFIDFVCGGVEYLGQLIVKYGLLEGNGVLFNDKDDVWYMEIVIGYYWVV